MSTSLPRVEPVALLVGEAAERSADVLAHRDPPAPEEVLQRRLARELLDEGAKLPEAGSAFGSRIADDRRDLRRQRRGERRHCTDGAVREALRDERLGADEDVETR